MAVPPPPPILPERDKPSKKRASARSKAQGMLGCLGALIILGLAAWAIIAWGPWSGNRIPDRAGDEIIEAHIVPIEDDDIDDEDDEDEDDEWDDDTPVIVIDDDQDSIIQNN